MGGHDNDFLEKAYEGDIYDNEIEHIVQRSSYIFHSDSYVEECSSSDRTM